jgi:hypothetical protein
MTCVPAISRPSASMAPLDPQRAEMLSLPACRRFLGKAGEGVSDDDLTRLREQMYAFAHCAVAVYE